MFSVAWSCSGFIATGSGDNAIRVFQEAASSGPHDGQTIERDEAAMHGLADDSTAASNGGMNGTTAVPDVEMLAQKLFAHKGDVNCVRWHPFDGTLLASAGDDGSVCIWRLIE